MAGGNWTAQNKIRPGIYINFTSKGSQSHTPGDRGTLAGIRQLSWGPAGELMDIAAGADMTPYIGYSITSPEARFLREALKGTDVTGGPTRILLYRPAAVDAAAASASLSGEADGVTATALYPGIRGNDISVSVSELVDEENTFIVTTLVDGVQVDQQTARTGGDLMPNAWVAFTGSAALTATAAVADMGAKVNDAIEAAESDPTRGLSARDVIIDQNFESPLLAATRNDIEPEPAFENTEAPAAEPAETPDDPERSGSDLEFC